MKMINLFLLMFLMFSTGCSSLKNELTPINSKKEVIQNAIFNFSKTSGLYKKDTVFSVSFFDRLHRMILRKTNDGNSIWVKGAPYEGIVAVSILANYNKILLTDTTKVGDKGGKMPTRYIEKKGKLFYWWDDNYPLTKGALAVFRKYNLLVENNLDGIMEFYNFSIDDSQKGVDYYFCKNNYLKYKKVTTNKGIGYYDAPKLNCE